MCFSCLSSKTRDWDWYRGEFLPCFIGSPRFRLVRSFLQKWKTHCESFISNLNVIESRWSSEVKKTLINVQQNLKKHSGFAHRSQLMKGVGHVSKGGNFIKLYNFLFQRRLFLNMKPSAWRLFSPIKVSGWCHVSFLSSLHDVYNKQEKLAFK